MYFGRISFLIEGCRCFNRKGQIFGHTLNVKSCLWVLFGSQKQIQISKNNPDFKKLIRSLKIKYNNIKTGHKSMHHIF